MSADQDFHLGCVTFKMPVRNLHGDGQRSSGKWFNPQIFGELPIVDGASSLRETAWDRKAVGVDREETQELRLGLPNIRRSVSQGQVGNGGVEIRRVRCSGD